MLHFYAALLAKSAIKCVQYNMTGCLRHTAAVAAACALIAAGAGCGPHAVAVSGPARRCPPPSTARILDQNGKPVTVTGEAATELAPPDPDGGLICRYGTQAAPAKLQLQAWAPLTARAARQLAAQLDGLPHGRPCCPPGATCAGVGGNYQSDTLILTYPHAPAAYVNVPGISSGPGPCSPATNDVVTRSSTQALIDTLKALVGGP